LAIGDWRLAIGDWRLAIGDWRLAIVFFIPYGYVIRLPDRKIAVCIPEGEAIYDCRLPIEDLGFHPEGMAACSRGLSASRYPRWVHDLVLHPGGMQSAIGDRESHIPSG